MAVSYKKLWHILLDRDMKKKDLQEAAELTTYAMSKLSRDENVTTEILGKICKALDCTTDDIIEFLPDEQD
ncbi:MAG: XRE family transcriptional regulator [Clostridia bacterium]|jgi:DNA-binding Xre family transcriptional regulator|nr:XRE family transcriptional regulator [Clostridia bacterium]NCD08627.1 XRE family transcriptional regulator [Negativicutes bacterium]